MAWCCFPVVVFESRVEFLVLSSTWQQSGLLGDNIGDMS